MKSKLRIALILTVLLAAYPAVLVSQEAAVPVAKSDPQQSEAQKQLAEIAKERDAKRRAAALEVFIREHPNSPALTSAYSSLLSALVTANKSKALKLTDEILAKYTDPKASIRNTAYSMKFYLLENLKKNDELDKLGLKLLESENDPALLQLAAQYDKANSVKLLEKAMAERRKDASATAPPLIEDLQWSLAQSLKSEGRKDEALRLSLEAIDAAQKRIAETEALPQDNPQRGSLNLMRRSLLSRYQALSGMLAEAGLYQRALEYLDLSAEDSGGNVLGGLSALELKRAGIYEKMGDTELQMDSYTRAFAARVEWSTQTKILELAKKTGADENLIFTRARELRKKTSVPTRPFELKTMDGQAESLDSLKSKVTLVNFFFPT